MHSLMNSSLVLVLLIGKFMISAAVGSDRVPDYRELRESFETPDHSRWGEVPLWWWEGQPMTKERATAQLELLAHEGVKSVCPIQRSPGRCDPQSFSPEWWDLFSHVNSECKRLGMTLWAYDQVGYGHYGWLEKAGAVIQDPLTKLNSSNGGCVHVNPILNTAHKDSGVFGDCSD